MEIKAYGDSAVQVLFENQIDPSVNEKVISLHFVLRHQHIPGILDTIPAYCSLTVLYDPLLIPYTRLIRIIQDSYQKSTNTTSPSTRFTEIPVWYNGEDLEFVCEYTGLSKEELIRLHSSTSYRVYMMGFLPGFPYLGGLDQRLFTPRRDTPRTRIPAGSVGIGGQQTGIYPVDSPGGWQLIGRTPIRLYDPEAVVPILLNSGDTVRFIPISKQEFYALEAESDTGGGICL